MNSPLNTCAAFVLIMAGLSAADGTEKGIRRSTVIENFDDGSVGLISYPGEDIDTSAWALDSETTYNNSVYSLKLYGNTWKIEAINALDLDTGTVWQVAAKTEVLGEIHGFGLLDSAHALLYAFSGTEPIDPDDWIYVYQGAFPLNAWNLYKLPVGEDWLAKYGYLPAINGIAFINDQDINTGAAAYFDEILDITEDLPFAPHVQIGYERGGVYRNSKGTRFMDIQFYSVVVDSDGYDHEYFWYFGDDSTSGEPDPLHTYVVTDNHPYTVLLDVVDRSGLHGRATCQVQVDPGPSSFPLRINFTGDVMIARRYEDPGGVIDTLGLEGIFEPTLPYLGDGADVTVANLECPFTTHGSPHPTKPIVFRGKPEYIKGLAYAGIDVVSLANNHTIDYGLEGLRETRDSLRANDILYSGAGANSYEAYQPAFLDRAGVNIAFLASSNRTGLDDRCQPYLNAGYNKPGFADLTAYKLGRQIRSVEDDADLKVVEMHSGIEYSLSPPRAGGYGPGDDGDEDEDEEEDEDYSPFCRVPAKGDIELRHQAIDEGADLVINHHPHLLQGLEVYKGKLIAHSLGNFIFDQTYAETFSSVILSACFDRAHFYGYSIVPVYIDHYVPGRAKGELGSHILNYMARRSRELNTLLQVDRDSVLARVLPDAGDPYKRFTVNTAEIEFQQDSGQWVSQPVRLADPGTVSSVSTRNLPAPWQFRLGRDVVWFGNFEDEGSSMWDLDEPDEYYDTVFYQGRRSLCQRRAQGSGVISTGLENRLPCYSDSTRYSIYGYMKLENSKNATIRAEFYWSRTLPIMIGYCALDPASGTDNWRFYHKGFTPAHGTRFYDLCFRSAGQQSGGQSMTWFDNAGIIEWTDWQDGDPQAVIQTPNDFYWVQVRTGNEASNATLAYQETFYDHDIAEQFLTTPGVVSDLALEMPGLGRTRMRITYHIPRRSAISLKIYNGLGQEVKTLANGRAENGAGTVVWDGRDEKGRRSSSGVYFCLLQAEDMTESRKFILLR